MEGSLADGGYFENTGLSTALNLFFTLESVLKNDAIMKEVFSNQSINSIKNNGKGFSKKKQVIVFRPKIIFLKNGLKSKDNVSNSLSWKYEFSPAVAFYNAWDRESYTTEFETQTIINLLNRRLENNKEETSIEDKKLKYDGFKIYDKGGNAINTTYDSKMSLVLEFIKFDLPREDGDLIPLGWMLSEFAADSIQIHLTRKNEILKKKILDMK